MFGFDIYERLETLTYEVKPTAQTQTQLSTSQLINVAYVAW